MGAVGSPLGVVRTTGHVPVSDVDHVQRRLTGEGAADRCGEERAERAAADRLRPARVGRITARAQVEVVVADEHLGHDRLGQLQATAVVQEEVVLQALRDQHEARFVAAAGDGHDGSPPCAGR
jgi:hypothetical protein